MTRVCQFCKRPYGEKCGKCGSEAVHQAANVPSVGITLWECMDCPHSWISGEEPPTHGICPTCAQKLELDAHLRGTDDRAARTSKTVTAFGLPD